MSDPVVLAPVVLARIEDDPNIQIVPIGARVPKILRLWLNRDATLLLTQTCVGALYSMPKVPEAIFAMNIPVQAVHPGQEPRVPNPDGSLILKPTMIVPDIGAKR